MKRKTGLLPGDIIVPSKRLSGQLYIGTKIYASTKVYKDRGFDRYNTAPGRGWNSEPCAPAIGTLRFPDIALVIGSFRRHSRRGVPRLKTKLMVMTKYGCGWVDGDNVTRV